MPDSDPRTVTLALRGRYTLAEAGELALQLRDAARPLRSGDRLVVDLSALERADGAAVAVLERFRRELESDGRTLELSSPPEPLAQLIRVYRGSPRRLPGSLAHRRVDLLTRTGESTATLAVEVWRWVAFVGSWLRTLPSIVRRPGSAHWKDIPALMERAGANAVPIVLVIDFLIGAVTAYEAALQLRRFGATLYVADLVGASIVRELGPLITAVVVTGRTGAAYAAELGTMAVSEEIDALRAMAFDPMRFLVVPRVLALLAVVPLLTLLGDAVGLIGGMLLSVRIGISAPEYMAETRSIVFVSDISWGVLKSLAFALAIGLIACQQGLAASGGAAGVGRRTTSAVVSILFALILIDAGFAPFLQGHFRR